MGSCGTKVGTDAQGILTEHLYLLVVFRMVVFRPFASEVIIAKVKSSDQDGIRRAFFGFLAGLCD